MRRVWIALPLLVVLAGSAWANEPTCRTRFNVHNDNTVVWDGVPYPLNGSLTPRLTQYRHQHPGCWISPILHEGYRAETLGRTIKLLMMHAPSEHSAEELSIRGRELKRQATLDAVTGKLLDRCSKLTENLAAILHSHLVVASTEGDRAMRSA